MATTPPIADQETQDGQPAVLSPLQFPDGYIPGQYAPWYCSSEDVYGPEELGEYANAIEEMTTSLNRAETAARLFEIYQAWEARLFRRGYHFNVMSNKGWSQAGSTSGVSTGATIFATANSGKLFPCNVYGARHDKIVAALSREVPGIALVAKDDKDPMDQAAAEEAEKYLKVFIQDANLKLAVTQAASLFYTDGRAGFLTYTIADQTRWGTEMPDRKQEVYGAPEGSSGVTPETELDGTPDSGGQGQGSDEMGSEHPARREITSVFGKLECKVPLMADEEHEFGRVRFSHEVSSPMLKAKYPWVAKKIATGGAIGDNGQIDRLARINVRLAVQASNSSGESYDNNSTETVTFFRPSEYWNIEDENIRKVYFDTFPDGLEVWHAGGTLAMVRNCRMSKHVKVVQCYPGDGQNRRAIGTNYLPLQKVLNAEISLIDRYHRSAIARRYALEPYIDTQQLNSQTNDPSKVTPVTGIEGKNLKISDITGMDSVPVPNTSLMEFVQWLINGAPEVMDGATPAMFGQNQGESDRGVYQTTKLNRDQALQVYAMPWAALCDAMSCVALQAVESAAENRQANISASLPGQQRLEIEIEKLQGNVLAYPESLEIPRTLAEQEEEMAQLLEQSANVSLYAQIMSDPRNLAVFSKFPSLAGLDVPGVDAVEQQQGEFEILMRSGPIQNPQLAQVQQQIQMGQAELAKAQAADPAGATGEAEQIMAMLQQLTQLAQTLPPLVSTVAVAQDLSENHAIHAAITLDMLNSPTGRKLMNGDDDQKAIWQNLKLHWQEHVEMGAKLTPPQPIETRVSFSGDITKLPPDAQAKAFQAVGLQVSPQELTPQEQTHEITQEKEGVDEQGVPVKQKVSVVGKPLN